MIVTHLFSWRRFHHARFTFHCSKCPTVSQNLKFVTIITTVGSVISTTMHKFTTRLSSTVTITMVTQLNLNEILSHSNTTLARWRPFTFHLLLTSFNGYSLDSATVYFCHIISSAQTFLTLIITTTSNNSVINEFNESLHNKTFTVDERTKTARSKCTTAGRAPVFLSRRAARLPRFLQGGETRWRPTNLPM